MFPITEFIRHINSKGETQENSEIFKDKRPTYNQMSRAISKFICLSLEMSLWQSKLMIFPTWR